MTNDNDKRASYGEYSPSQAIDKEDFVKLLELKKERKLSPLELMKVIEYRTILEQQVMYQNRSEYFELWEAFNTNNIDFIVFQERFLKTYREHCQIVKSRSHSPEKIKRFRINDKSSGFLELIRQLKRILFKRTGLYLTPVLETVTLKLELFILFDDLRKYE